jgi:hypothetical protein
MAAVQAAGGVMDFVTFTVRHHRGRRLAEVWDAVTVAWGSVTSGAEWMRDKSGMLGWAKVIEVTHTRRSGWHVHVHALVAWAEPVTEAHSAQVALRAWRRWDRALLRRGFDSTPVRGVDTRRVVGGDEGLAGYIGKAALDLTSTWTKEGGAGRSPFALLRDAVETYEAGDTALWWEFEATSWGRKMLTWSTGRADLRRFAGLGRKRTDEEVAAADTGGDDAVVLVGETWSRISRERQQAELLAVTDEGGIPAVVAWLNERDLSLRWARPHAHCREPRARACGLTVSVLGAYEATFPGRSTKETRPARSAGWCGSRPARSAAACARRSRPPSPAGCGPHRRVRAPAPHPPPRHPCGLRVRGLRAPQWTPYAENYPQGEVLDTPATRVRAARAITDYGRHLGDWRRSFAAS